MSEATPPQNLEAEQSVLGSMVVSEAALRSVRVESGLTPAHFYLDKHREIFAAIGRVLDRHGTADELMVGNEVPEHRNYIAELAAKVPAVGNAVHYAEIVLHHAKLRANLEGAQRIIAGVRERDEERSAELIREGLQLAASDLTVDAETTSGEGILREVFDEFDRGEEAEVFELPWPDLNLSVMGGYRRKQMTVLAGWTNMGKSWVLDQMLDAFHRQGCRTAIFATEMSKQERAHRWLTGKTGVSLERLMRNQLTEEDYSKLYAAANQFGGRLPFDYFEAFGWSADRICERIIFGDYDVVAVDPVTEIPGFTKPETAAEATRRFAEVAGRANCHVILVSHLNRQRLRDPNGVKPRPVLADLKGSGGLETNAHAVLFLHREQDSNTAHILPEGELFIAKVRNGLQRGIEVVQLARTHQFIPAKQHTQEELTGMEAA